MYYVFYPPMQTLACKARIREKGFQTLLTLLQEMSFGICPRVTEFHVNYPAVRQISRD